MSLDGVTRDPFFTGSSGTIVETFDNRADARSYIKDLRNGNLDPFLAQAWKEVDVRQVRRPDGKFGEGFRVTVTYSRPGPGDDSGAINPDPGIEEGTL